MLHVACCTACVALFAYDAAAMVDVDGDGGGGGADRWCRLFSVVGEFELNANVQGADGEIHT